MDAARLFFAVATQWRTVFTTVIGLDYAAVRTVAEWRRIEISLELFKDLQVMEQAALSKLNKPKR